MSTKVQIARINNIIDFLDIVHRSKFNLLHYVGNEVYSAITPDPHKMSKNPEAEGDCNTSACLIGWLPHIFPKSAKWKESYGGTWDMVEIENTDLRDNKLFEHLTGFSEEGTYDITEIINYTTINPTPKQVITRIKKVAKQEGINLN